MDLREDLLRELIRADIVCIRSLRKGPPREGDPHLESILYEDLKLRLHQRKTYRRFKKMGLVDLEEDDEY